jgi:hypothetical protein
MKSRLSSYLQHLLGFILAGVALLTPLIFPTTPIRSYATPKNTVKKIGAALIAVALVGKALTGGTARLPRSILWSNLAVAASWLLSTAFSSRPALSMWGTWIRGGGLAEKAADMVISLGAANLEPVQKATVEDASFISAAGVAGLAFWQKYKGDPITGEKMARPVSTIGNADFYPHYIEQVLPLAAGRFLANPHPEAKVAWLGYIGFLLGGVAISKTRGSILGLCGALCGVLLGLPRDTLYRNRWWLGGAAAMAGGMLLINRKKLNLGQRAKVWKDGLRAIGEKPILGSGPCNIRTLMTQHKSMETGKGEALINYDRTHNEYLDEVLMRGSVGLLARLGAATAQTVELMKRRGPATAGPLGSMAANAGHNCVSFETQATSTMKALVSGLATQPTGTTTLSTVGKVLTVVGGLAFAIGSAYWAIRFQRASDAYCRGESFLPRINSLYASFFLVEGEQREKNGKALTEALNSAIYWFERAVKLNPFDPGFVFRQIGGQSGYADMILRAIRITPPNEYRDLQRGKIQNLLKATINKSDCPENIAAYLAASYEEEANEATSQKVKEELLRVAMYWYRQANHNDSFIAGCWAKEAELCELLNDTEGAEYAREKYHNIVD